MIHPHQIDATMLVDECEAYLAGHSAEYALRIGRTPEPWEWLNLLAHGTTAEILGQARLRRGRRARQSWVTSRASMCSELLDLVGDGFGPLHAVQSAVLVPLELAVIAVDRPARWTPADFVADVGSALDRRRAAVQERNRRSGP